MDLQILYNNPRKAKMIKKENPKMKPSFKKRKKNPESRVYKRSMELSQLNVLQRQGEGKKVKDFDPAKFSAQKKKTYILGKKKFLTDKEFKTLQDKVTDLATKAAEAAQAELPGAAKLVDAAEAAKKKLAELRKSEKERRASEAAIYEKKGYGPDDEISPRKAMKLNKQEARKKEKVDKDARQFSDIVSKLERALKGSRKKRKKVEKKVRRKKASKKASRKKVAKKASRKKVVRKKTSRKASYKKPTRKASRKSTRKKVSSKRATRRKNIRRRGNPIKVFENPKEKSLAMKKVRKVTRKKSKKSKKSSIAHQLADMAGVKKSKKRRTKKKASKKKASRRKSSIKALSHLGKKSKKHYKSKKHKVRKNPTFIENIKEKIMRPVFGKQSLTNHTTTEALELLGGGALIKLYDHAIKRPLYNAVPFLGRMAQMAGPMAPAVDGLVDVVAAAVLGNILGFIPKVGDGAKKGIIGAAVVQFGVKLVSSASTAAGMPMQGIIGVPSMNGIIATPSMNGIIGVPSMGQYSADFQGLGATGMTKSDFGAYQTVGMEGSYIQDADFDSAGPIPTAPRNPEALNTFAGYENVEYSDDGEDADF